MRTLIIDNYDSFTYNLAQLVAKISGIEPLVVLNDEYTWQNISRLEFSQVILSPGPGRPDRDADFGICRDAILRSRWPVLGVCLGHQGLAHFFGGKVVHAPMPMHGRISRIRHDQSELFEGIESPFQVVRYHSLIAGEVPEQLAASAWTDDGLVMGLRHRSLPMWGVQFHPESIETHYGDRLIANFLRLSEKAQGVANGRVPTALRCPRDETLSLFMFCREICNSTLPEDAFARICAVRHEAVWLDSSLVTSGRSRFSFIGDASGPHSEVLSYSQQSGQLRVTRQIGETTLNKSIFDYLDWRLRTIRLESSANLPFEFCGGYVGYFGYELKSETGGSQVHASTHPDAQFIFLDRVICFDHETGKVWLLCCDLAQEVGRANAWLDEVSAVLLSNEPVTSCVSKQQTATVPSFSPRHSDNQYLGLIDRAMRDIRDGESYEICLTNQLQCSTKINGLSAYTTLRRLNPAPYSAYMRFGELEILCSSPERFVRVGSDRSVESKPIKGTLRRSQSAEEDEALAKQLRNSEKDRSENLMIVDLIRNDLGKVCEVGSVAVPKLFDIETYATVHQMVSTVVGRLRADKSTIDCIKALFPGGSMTGAPKVRTMEIIDKLEAGPRGIYSGALGYLSLNGAADLNIVIRTIVMDAHSSSIGVGGAIVALSDPASELDETKLKASALIRALEVAATSSAHPGNTLATQGPNGSKDIYTGSGVSSVRAKSDLVSRCSLEHPPHPRDPSNFHLT